MKLLVTGGAGFIGSNFILYWLDKYPQDTILNVDVLTYAGNLENLYTVEKNPGYQFIKADIGDKNKMKEIAKGSDIIVHFAAESHVDRSILDASKFVYTNVVGTYNLLEAALEKGIRFHHISTDEVFGELDLDSSVKFSEITSYNPQSPYSASKASSDHLVRAYHHTYGLPVTITNCSNNFGPYQFPEKLIPLAITNLMEGKKVPVYGDGLYVRDWLYVTDHCRAIDVVIHKGQIGETYCIGGMTKEMSNLEIIRKIISLMGASDQDIQFVKDRLGHDRKYAVDWTKIHHQFGWKPEHDFEKYLEMTVAWYRDHQDWWKHVKTGAYEQYYQKQYGGIK